MCCLDKYTQIEKNGAKLLLLPAGNTRHTGLAQICLIT